MSLPAYSRYRPSGAAELLPTPAHWVRCRFGHILKERTERSDQGHETLLSVSAYTGVRPRAEMLDSGEPLSRAESLEGYKRCFNGDLVVNIMLAWNRGLGFTSFDGIVSPSYCVFSPCRPFNTRFLDYLVRSNEYTGYFGAHSFGVIESRLRLYPDVFLKLACSLPPREEQDTIAAFLDRETAKIDELVAEQQQMVARARELRQAIRSDSVTSGLTGEIRAAVPSGIAWAPSLPIGWRVARVRRLSTFITSGPRGWSERVGDTGALFVQSGDLGSDMRIQMDTARRVPVQQDAEAARCALRKGDVVVCITGAKTGNVALCDHLPEPAFINQHLCLIRPRGDVLPEYLALALRADLGQLYFRRAQYGLKQGLSLDDVRDAVVFLPTVAEQQAIVEHVRTRTAKVEPIEAEAQRMSQLLQERRAALISAAVTGQIDVRGLVAA